MAAVGNAVFRKRTLRVRRQLRRDQREHVIAVQYVAGRSDQSAVDPQRRRLARHEDEIAGLALGHQLEPASQGRVRLRVRSGC
jgi:hypothetical protein